VATREDYDAWLNCEACGYWEPADDGCEEGGSEGQDVSDVSDRGRLVHTCVDVGSGPTVETKEGRQTDNEWGLVDR